MSSSPNIRGLLVDPEDFESFALVCRGLYNLASHLSKQKTLRAMLLFAKDFTIFLCLPILEEDKHASLKKQFSRVSLSLGSYDSRLAELLRHVFEHRKQMGYFLSLPQPGRIQRSSFIIRSFSALPNELVIKMRGFLIDPNDFESFALVSKWFRAISLPILKEDKHTLLKKRFSRVSLSHYYYDSRLAELFRHFLEKSKMKYYVRELCIENKWAIHWEELLNTTTAVLQQATQNSTHITPSLFFLWDTEIGKEGSLLALLFQRLSSLRKLKFSDIDLKDQHLVR